MIPDKPFTVDRWYCWSDGELRRTRCRYATQEEAERSAQSWMEMGDTTRVRLSKDSSCGGRPTVIKVWEK